MQSRCRTEWRAGSQEQVAWLKAIETEGELISKLVEKFLFKGC